MGLFSRTELPDLLASVNQPCVSIHLSTSVHRDREAVQKQFEQIVRSAWQQLHDQDSADSPQIAAKFLEAVQSIQQQAVDALISESLVIFYALHWLRWCRLPGRVTEVVRVAQAFDLKPLLLAGIPQVLSTYRQFNRTSTMLNSDLIGNLDTMKLKDLHQQAWNRVQESVSREREQAFRQYQQSLEQGLALNHLGEIITKAIDCKVETLFIASTYQKWGRFNPYTWEVDVHWQAEPGDIDLTQLAIEQTLLHGGAVYIMLPEPAMAKTSASGRSAQTKSAFDTIAAILRS